MERIRLYTLIVQPIICRDRKLPQTGLFPLLLLAPKPYNLIAHLNTTRPRSESRRELRHGEIRSPRQH